MNPKDIRPNTVIKFKYSNSHPNKDRTVYVKRIKDQPATNRNYPFLLEAFELDDYCNKNFRLQYIVNPVEIPHVELPIEALSHSTEIFAKMLQCDTTEVDWYNLGSKLIAIQKSGTDYIQMSWSATFKGDGISINLGNKKNHIQLSCKNGRLRLGGLSDPNSPNATAESLIEYLQKLI